MGKSNVYTDGNTLIQDVYAGSDVVSQIYRGSELIYCVYYDGQTVFEKTTTGSYTFTPKVKGLYQVICVGGGGGGSASTDQPKYAGKAREGGGSSGAIVIANFYISKGTECQIEVGDYGAGTGQTTTPNAGWSGSGGDSSFSIDEDVFASATGGGGAYTKYNTAIQHRDGGVATVSGQKEIIKQEDGVIGESKSNYNTAMGAPSKYENYGGGGSASTGSSYSNGYNGQSGCVIIKYLGHATS